MNPKDLPVYAIADELVAALQQHQAVVVEGPTGSGKTTQMPQILRDAHIVPDDLILGVTQPRRLAAISVAHRIAFERGVEMGDEVAYAIRFDDQSGPNTRVKIMTDGLLLQEARTDPDLSRYGVIMIDEAHERSLNIDFTLGLLRQILDRRPEMKVVISSATINAGIFSRFFKDCPRLAVKVKPFPIEIRYDAIDMEDYWGRPAATAAVIRRLHLQQGPGDILVFLPGAGPILDVITDLESRRLKGAEIIPLYGRLTREEQERVFAKFPGKRKIILSTNIAETSLTIDGVRFVVDQGIAKVPRYDPRTGIPSLQEERVSKASASQRAGRSGRTAPGVCVRLYSKDDYEDRPGFAIEEVLRMDLSEVVLRMIDLGIRDVETFPFVTRPPKTQLRGAVGLLMDLGAITKDRELTPVGRRMVPFPLAPRQARMLVEAADRFPEVFGDVLTVCALLSIRWPQVMPGDPERVDEARAAHKRWSDPRGDIVAALRWVRAYENAPDRDRFCEGAHLDPVIMLELLKVREQLADISRSAGLSGGDGGDPGLVIRCLTSAYPRRICQKGRKGNTYETATGVRVSIHPGSCLIGKGPRFIVAADIVETTRTWARAVSLVEPKWILDADPELAERWGLRRNRRSKDGGKPQIEVPQRVMLFGQSRRVKVRRGRPDVIVAWEDLRLATELDRDALCAELPKNLTVSAKLGQDNVLEGVPLLNALQVAELLTVFDAPPRRWPEGDVLDPERDLHHVIRLLPFLMRRVASRRRKRAAWLTLIPNGAGGYWFDAVKDLRLSCEQTCLALTALSGEGIVQDADREKITEHITRIGAVLEALTAH